MQALLDAIRERCPPPVWQRATQLAQNATVTGKRTHNDEVELRVITRGGMASPLVCLSPADLDWSCECDSQDDACIHVAAGAMWIGRRTDPARVVVTSGVQEKELVITGPYRSLRDLKDGEAVTITTPEKEAKGKDDKKADSADSDKQEKD